MSANAHSETLIRYFLEYLTHVATFKSGSKIFVINVALKHSIGIDGYLAHGSPEVGLGAAQGAERPL